MSGKNRNKLSKAAAALTLGAHRQQVVPQHVRGALKQRLGRGHRARRLHRHAHRLGALAGEEEGHLRGREGGRNRGPGVCDHPARQQRGTKISWANGAAANAASKQQQGQRRRLPWACSPQTWRRSWPAAGGRRAGGGGGRRLWDTCKQPARGWLATLTPRRDCLLCYSARSASCQALRAQRRAASACKGAGGAPPPPPPLTWTAMWRRVCRAPWRTVLQPSAHRRGQGAACQAECALVAFAAALTRSEPSRRSSWWHSCSRTDGPDPDQHNARVCDAAPMMRAAAGSVGSAARMRRCISSAWSRQALLHAP